MAPTELSDRMEQLRAELAVARRSVADYDAMSIEARDMAAEQLTHQGSWAYTSAQIRYRGQAISWQRRVQELSNQIADLESVPAVAAPVVLSGDEVRGMDEMAGVL